MQTLLLGKLSKQGVELEDMLLGVTNIALKGKLANPVTGELEENDKIKLDAYKLLLEIVGALKGKGSVNIHNGNNNFIKLQGIINGNKTTQ